MLTKTIPTKDPVHSLNTLISTTNQDMLLLIKFVEEIGYVTNDESGLIQFDYSHFINRSNLFNSGGWWQGLITSDCFPHRFDKKSTFMS